MNRRDLLKSAVLLPLGLRPVMCGPTSGKDTNSVQARQCESDSIRALLKSIRIRDGKLCFSLRHPNSRFGILAWGWWAIPGKKVDPRWQSEADGKHSSSTSRRCRVCRLWMCCTSAAIGATFSQGPEDSTSIRCGDLLSMPLNVKGYG